MKYKIYKLIDNTNGDIYIGMTIRRLQDRMKGHRRKHNGCVSRKIIANGDYRIELIEETDDKTRERYWIENTECINYKVPGRTLQESSKAYREKPSRKAYAKAYKQTEKYKKQSSEYTKKTRKYEYSWGGDKRSSNNLLLINTNLFLI